VHIALLVTIRGLGIELISRETILTSEWQAKTISKRTYDVTLEVIEGLVEGLGSTWNCRWKSRNGACEGS
jgi:hypothetical protein